MSQDIALMRIEEDERFYKFFFFRPKWGRPQSLEHRIFTKEKADGTLELVSYTYKVVDGVVHKEGVIRAPSVLKDQLDGVIQNMIKRTNTSPAEFEEIDLSKFATLEEQLDYLEKRDLASKSYMH
jgi:hypothetical protein